MWEDSHGDRDISLCQFEEDQELPECHYCHVKTTQKVNLSFFGLLSKASLRHNTLASSLGSPTAGCRLDKALRTWAQKTIWVPTQRDGAPWSDTGLSYLWSLEVKITWPSLPSWPGTRSEDLEVNPFQISIVHSPNSQQNFPVSSWIIYTPWKIIYHPVLIETSFLAAWGVFISSSLFFSFSGAASPALLHSAALQSAHLQQLQQLQNHIHELRRSAELRSSLSFPPANSLLHSSPALHSNTNTGYFPVFGTSGSPFTPVTNVKENSKESSHHNNVSKPDSSSNVVSSTIDDDDKTGIKVGSSQLTSCHGNYSTRSGDKPRGKNVSNWFEMSGPWETEMLKLSPCCLPWVAIISDNFSCDCQSKRLPPALWIYFN